MCMMCIEFQKGRMNIREVAKALMETTDEKHGQEIIDGMLTRDKETAEQFTKAMQDALSEYMRKTVQMQKDYAFYSQCEDTAEIAEQLFNEICREQPRYESLLRLQMMTVRRVR